MTNLPLPILNQSATVRIVARQSITLPMPAQLVGNEYRFISVNHTFALPYSFAAGKLGGYTSHVGVGSQVLYSEASGLEKAMADADAERLIATDAELIKDIWDPQACPLPLLPYLAWAMGVNFWNDDWSETTKRNWISRQWEFKSKRGSVDGLAMAVDFAGRDVSPFGYELLSVITQPQKIFPGPSITTEQRLAWIETLPQVRVFYYYVPGIAGPHKAFMGSSRSQLNKSRNFYMEGMFSIPSIAKQHLQRQATWYPTPGQPTDIPVVDRGSFYELHLWGQAGSKVFADKSTVPSSATKKFLQPSDAWKRIVTIEPQTAAGSTPLAVGPSLTAIQAPPQLITIAGQASYGAFCGSQYVHGTGAILGDGHTDMRTNRFFIPSTSKYRIYEAYAVMDPDSIAHRVPVSAVSAFTGAGYLGWPDYTAQVNVFMPSQRSKYAASSEGLLTPKTRYFIPHDPKPMQYVSLALEAARAMRDKILLKAGPFPDFVAGKQQIAGKQFIVSVPDQPVLTSPYKP